MCVKRNEKGLDCNRKLKVDNEMFSFELASYSLQIMCSLLQCKIQELLKSVGEWESKADTQKKEKMEREIRERIEFEELVRDKIAARKKRIIK